MRVACIDAPVQGKRMSLATGARLGVYEIVGSEATPQMEVGHLDRLAQIEGHLAAVPGLFLTGAGLRAIGLPDVIADARKAAAAISLVPSTTRDRVVTSSPQMKKRTHGYPGFGSLAGLASALPLALLVTGAAAARAEDSWDAVARVVAVGDVHGDYDQLVVVLRDAGLVDAGLRWAGGKTHLVQTGDRVDRGAESRKVMDLLMRLEKEAKKAGGMVHSLLGNHEAMNVLGDLRDVSPDEFTAFKAPDSQRRRTALWERLGEERRRRGEPAPSDEDRRRFEAEIPLGWVEHRQAFDPKGTYGAWLSRQNAVIRIGETLFLHGGLSPKYGDFSLTDLNERIRRELREADPTTAIVTTDGEGPLWYRGLAQGDPALSPHLDAVLRRHGARRMVIGHTVTEGLVMPHFGGRVLAIDVGLARVYGGPPAALILEGGQAFALHRGKRLALPEGEGEPVLSYVKEVSAMEPDPSRLKGLIRRLEAALSAAAPSPP